MKIEQKSDESKNVQINANAKMSSAEMFDNVENELKIIFHPLKNLKRELIII